MVWEISDCQGYFYIVLQELFSSHCEGTEQLRIA